jgi:hypothetical protein
MSNSRVARNPGNPARVMDPATLSAIAVAVGITTAVCCSRMIDWFICIVTTVTGILLQPVLRRWLRCPRRTDSTKPNETTLAVHRDGKYPILKGDEFGAVDQHGVEQ